MPDPFTATMMSAGIGTAISISEAGSAKKARSAASAKEDKARAEQLAIEEQKLELAKEDRARWDSIYGPMEQNLASFYGGLSEADVVNFGLQAQTQEFDRVRIELEESLAQRRIDPSSGAAIEVERGLLQTEAEARATTRAEAPFKLAEAQSSFLNLGLQRPGATSAGERAALTSESAVYGATATSAVAEAEAARIAEAEAISGIGTGLSTIGSTIGGAYDTGITTTGLLN